MLKLEDVRDMISQYGITSDDHVYMGVLDNKAEKSIGVYNSKREESFRIPLGGLGNAKSGQKKVTFLVHWNNSERESEKAAYELARCLAGTKDIDVNEQRIYFMQSTVPIPVGTDEGGTREYVIESDVYYEERWN